MRVGSLFSGIAGIELGLERAGGFETAWFVECDPYAQVVLRKHYPTIPIYDDVKNIRWKELPKIDMLTGGFPCQDVSVANPKGGGVATGKKSSLWKHYAEAIRTLRPRFALIENVTNLSNKGLNIVLSDLAKMRYDAEWFDLRAADFGLPHIRERLFIIAYPPHDHDGEQCEKSTKETHDGHSGRVRVSRLYQELATIKVYVDASFSREDVEAWYDELSEPAFLGAGNGFFNRKDRTKCVGNAVSPRCAEAIGRAINESMNVGRREKKKVA